MMSITALLAIVAYKIYSPISKDEISCRTNKCTLKHSRDTNASIIDNHYLTTILSTDYG